MHQNVTVAEAIVLSCFDIRPPRNRIVFEDGLFPSVRYVQQAWARFGAEVVVCEDAEAVIGAIDERTLLVPVSHVLYKSAEIQPVERIAQRAKDAGARVLLDAYQSAGTVPLDVVALGIDFCVGGSVKWLCGGPGAGWLYVRPDVAEELQPAFAGWQAHARPFAFEPEMVPAPGVGRFLTGTPNVPANYAASAGYEIIAEIGVDRIRENSMRQTAYLVDLVDAAGFELTSPREPEVRGGSVVFRVPDFQAVHAELARRDIICDYATGCRHPLRAALLHDRRRDSLRGRAGEGDSRVRRAPRAGARGRGLLAPLGDRAERKQHDAVAPSGYKKLRSRSAIAGAVGSSSCRMKTYAGSRIVAAIVRRSSSLYGGSRRRR